MSFRGILVAGALAMVSIGGASADGPRQLLPDWETYTCAWFLNDFTTVMEDKGGLSSIDRAMTVNEVMSFAAGYAQSKVDEVKPGGVIKQANIQLMAQQLSADCRAAPNKPVFEVMRAAINRAKFN